jgi:hypothetical protein
VEEINLNTKKMSAAALRSGSHHCKQCSGSARSLGIRGNTVSGAKRRPLKAGATSVVVGLSHATKVMVRSDRSKRWLIRTV